MSLVTTKAKQIPQLDVAMTTVFTKGRSRSLWCGFWPTTFELTNPIIKIYDTKLFATGGLLENLYLLCKSQTSSAKVDPN